jgi:hypothetical protein
MLHLPHNRGAGVHRQSNRHSRLAIVVVAVAATLFSASILAASPAQALPACQTKVVLDQNFANADVGLCIERDGSGSNWRAGAKWLKSGAGSHVMFVELVAPVSPGSNCLESIARNPQPYTPLYTYGATAQTPWVPRWFLGRYCVDYWNFYQGQWYLGARASFTF